MSAHNCHCDTLNREFPAGRGRTAEPNAKAPPRQPIWRAAFASFGTAALRLHRLREVRMEMLNNALEKLEYKEGDE